MIQYLTKPATFHMVLSFVYWLIDEPGLCDYWETLGLGGLNISPQVRLGFWVQCTAQKSFFFLNYDQCSGTSSYRQQQMLAQDMLGQILSQSLSISNTALLLSSGTLALACLVDESSD